MPKQKNDDNQLPPMAVTMTLGDNPQGIVYDSVTTHGYAVISKHMYRGGMMTLSNTIRIARQMGFRLVVDEEGTP